MSQPSETPPGDTPATAIAHPRTVRSFVRRAGRTTVGQTRALAELGPSFLLPYQPSAIDLVAGFQASTGPGSQFHSENPGPLVLEIGFGMGEATAHIAALLPHTRFLCCEVHEPGIGALLKRMAEQNLTNIRIVAHDAVEVIDHMLTPASLDGVHIFFPDPWHKTRHHKRRLIQPALVARLADRLKPGGYLHCATDWQPYAVQMLDVLGREPRLRNRHPQGAEGIEPGYAPRPAYRPQTKFERRGLRLGHGVWDVVFERV